jgi:hypothetical protein
MKTTIKLTLLAIASVGVLAGCTETLDSKNIKTAGISATIEATATSDSSTSVKATLKAGGDESNTYIDLSDGDAIFASADGDKKEMSAESTGEYVASFGKANEGLAINVSLERADDDPAPKSDGTMPAPFTLDALPATPVSRAEDITITWSPTSSDSMSIHIDGSCIFFDDIDVPGDTGSFTIQGGTIDATNDEKMETCDITVDVSRTRGGTADPDALLRALKEGWIAGAGLDAHEIEPLPEDSPFWDAPNTIVTPHYGATTRVTYRRGADIFLDNLRRYVNGEALVNVVDKEAGY